MMKIKHYGYEEGTGGGIVREGDGLAVYSEGTGGG